MPDTIITTQVTSFWGIIKEVVVSSLPKFVAGACFFLIFVIVGFIIKWCVCHKIKKKPEKKVLYNLIGKSLLLLFVLIGVIVGLGTAGVSTASLVTSLGLTGFAIGYAMKDILTNIMAGAIIISGDSVKVGDSLTVNNNTGTIIDINLRHTTLDNETAEVLVPNGTLLTAISSINKPTIKKSESE